MAKIESYVLANAPLSGSDKLIGTDTAHNNATKNFSISELITFITDSSVYVPYSGATGNVDLNNNDLIGVITFASNDILNNNLISTYDLDISNSLYLSASQGALGEVLTSQGPGNPPIWSSAGSGPQGIQGPAGPQGPVGPVGPAGLNWQGVWVSGTSYIVDDAVGYAGASWFCINPTSGTTPPDVDTVNWALLAAQGAQGPAGPAGAQGPTGATGPQGASGNNTLQQVLNNSSSLTNGRNFQGTGSGTGNLGFNVNGFGTNCATNNSGSRVNAFGVDAADNNTANDLNAFGNSAAANNTGVNVNAFGFEAGLNNTHNSVNLFGSGATASGNDQLVLRSQLGYNARISYNSLTNTRTYTLPDDTGTISLEKYLVYTALISAPGGVPTATVLRNTFGTTFNWTNPSNGILRVTAAAGAPFTAGKTWITSGGFNNAGQPYIVTSQRANLSPTTMVDFYFFLYDGTISGTPNVTDFSIEIRVYL